MSDRGARSHAAMSEIQVQLLVPRARALALLVLAAVALTACRGAEEPAPVPAEPVVATEPEPEPEPVLTERAPLTGELIEDATAAALAEQPLLIVKVENSAAARPQTGLDDADVVFEELVEGGITRFIALFHSQVPDRVGPVRSARPVDVELGSGYGRPVFAHSGARTQVQTLLRSSPMVAIEEGQAAGFERDRSRRSPHNVYVQPDPLLEAGTDRGAAPLPEVGWVFDEEPPAGAVTCPDAATGCTDPGGEIAVHMSGRSVTGWRYDEDTGRYHRKQDGQDFTVTGEGRVGAANVVVLATRHYTGGCCDTAGSPYSETEVLGGDRAVVLRDGRWYEARWHKASATAPLLLADEAGRAFPLKPGPTWVLLPDARAVPVAPVG